jgi:hypothetical protein
MVHSSEITRFTDPLLKRIEGLEKKIQELDSKYPSVSRQDLSDVLEKQIHELIEKNKKMERKIVSMERKLKASLIAVAESE